MSFWSDASGATKGIIIVGGILLIIGLIYLVYPAGPEQASHRGIEPDEGVPAEQVTK